MDFQVMQVLCSSHVQFCCSKAPCLHPVEVLGAESVVGADSVVGEILVEVLQKNLAVAPCKSWLFTS